LFERTIAESSINKLFVQVVLAFASWWLATPKFDDVIVADCGHEVSLRMPREYINVLFMSPGNGRVRLARMAYNPVAERAVVASREQEGFVLWMPCK